MATLALLLYNFLNYFVHISQKCCPATFGAKFFYSNGSLLFTLGGLTMVTYSELIQTGIFIVALIGLCYTVFKGKK